MFERLEAPPVYRVRRVLDQLAQENVFVGIDRMNHQVEELPRLGLKVKSLCGGAH